MPVEFPIRMLVNWLLTLLFVLLGLGNCLQVSVVPGVFYLLVSLGYCPPVVGWLGWRTGVRIPYWFRLLFALLLLWATLAVGDLAELYGL